MSVATLANCWTGESEAGCLNQFVPGYDGDILDEWVLVDEELNRFAASSFGACIHGIDGDDGLVVVWIEVEEAEDGEFLGKILGLLSEFLVKGGYLGDVELEVGVEVEAVGNLVVDLESGFEDDAEVEASTPDAPEEVRIGLLGDGDDGSVGEHEADGKQGIEDETMKTGQPTNTSTKGAA